jgi:acetyl-CoA acetyltransferase
MYGDTCSGQRALYELAFNGIPIINVNNACATGSTALYLARQAVESGAADCVLALGFEQMVPGALGAVFNDRPSSMDKYIDTAAKLQGHEVSGVPVAMIFGSAAHEHMAKYGTRPETFGQIAVKARRHAHRNPNAVFREELSLEQVMESSMVYAPLTRYQCCPPTTGAAAAVVCSEEFARRHGLSGGVEILAQSMTTDLPGVFDARSGMSLVGYDMAAAASRAVYEAAGVDVSDIDVVELHDCFTANELIAYEALGLTEAGGAEKFIADGDNTYGGKYVTNPSGGLLSKGHPIGATGLAQCAELVWQLRGQAGARQVEGARLGLQHNLGLGGACVVTLYGSV